jgi:hypothetical protein
VRAERIATAVTKVVDTGDAERLLVYLAGHGVAVGTWDGLWLLSEADKNPNAAVNISKRRAGPPERHPPPGLRRRLVPKPTAQAPAELHGQPHLPERRHPTGRPGRSGLRHRVGRHGNEKIPEGAALEAFGNFTRTLRSGLAGGQGASARLIRDTCTG